MIEAINFSYFPDLIFRLIICFVLISSKSYAKTEDNQKYQQPEWQCHAIDDQLSVKDYLSSSAKSGHPLRNHARNLALEFSKTNWLVLKRSFPEVADHIDIELYHAKLWSNQQFHKCVWRLGCRNNATWLASKQSQSLQNIATDTNNSWQQWQINQEELGKAGLQWLEGAYYAGEEQDSMNLMNDVLVSVQMPEPSIQWAVKTFGEVQITFELGTSTIENQAGMGILQSYEELVEATNLELDEWIEDLQRGKKEIDRFSKWSITATQISQLMREPNDYLRRSKLNRIAREISILSLSKQMMDLNEYLRRSKKTRLASYAPVKQFIRDTQEDLQYQWKAVQNWHLRIQQSSAALSIE